MRILYITVVIVAIIFIKLEYGQDRIIAQNSQIAVIVNIDNPIAEMNAGTAKLYYLRKVKKRWPQINKTIKPVDRKGNPQERLSFFAKVLKMNADDVEQYFIERKISNAESPPVKLNSDKEIIEYVSQNIGAIGYINKSSATSQVKIIYSTP